MRAAITFFFLALSCTCIAQVADQKVNAETKEVVISCEEWDTHFAYKVKSHSVVGVVYKQPSSFEPVANEYLEGRGYKLEQRCPETAAKILENEAKIMERSLQAEVVETLG